MSGTIHTTVEMIEDLSIRTINIGSALRDITDRQFQELPINVQEAITTISLNLKGLDEFFYSLKDC